MVIIGILVTLLAIALFAYDEIKTRQELEQEDKQ